VRHQQQFTTKVQFWTLAECVCHHTGGAGSKPLWRIKTILCLKNARLNRQRALTDGTGGGTRMTVERAKIDRVCALSKQIIVIQKQDCGGLALVHTVPSPTWVVKGTNKKRWSGTARLVCHHSRRPDLLYFSPTLPLTLSLFGVSPTQSGASK
jgi:hypothetical protein